MDFRIKCLPECILLLALELKDIYVYITSDIYLPKMSIGQTVHKSEQTKETQQQIRKQKCMEFGIAGFVHQNKKQKTAM